MYTVAYHYIPYIPYTPIPYNPYSVNWFLKGENTPISLYDLTLLRSIVSQYDGTIISAVGISPVLLPPYYHS